MKLEYLIERKEQMQDIWRMKLCTGDICGSVQQIEGTDTWLLKYEIYEDGPGYEDREFDAEELYRIQQFIQEKYHPLVLANEAADFYTQTLYPEFCTYERNLRRLLYIKGTLCEDESVTRRLKHLERKTLSQMFQLLFTDENFVKEVKRLGEIEGWRITKDEVMENLVPCEEKTVWNELMGEDVQRVFRKKFLFLKEMRNKVMHAQDMEPVEFRKARALLREVNQQLLDESIGVKQRLHAMDHPLDRDGGGRNEFASGRNSGRENQYDLPAEGWGYSGICDQVFEETGGSMNWPESARNIRDGFDFCRAMADPAQMWQRKQEPYESGIAFKSAPGPVPERDMEKSIPEIDAGFCEDQSRGAPVPKEVEDMIDRDFTDDEDEKVPEEPADDGKATLGTGLKTALGVAMGLALFPGLLPAVGVYAAKQVFRRAENRKSDDNEDSCADEPEEQEDGPSLWEDDWD